MTAPRNAPQSGPKAVQSPTATPSQTATVTAPQTAPTSPFSFDENVTVPGRGNGTNAMDTDREYLALKDKLAAQHKAHQDGSLPKDKGTAFTSPDVKKHVRYLRAAANALNIGVSIKSPDTATGKIMFRAKERKQYTKPDQK